MMYRPYTNPSGESRRKGVVKRKALHLSVLVCLGAAIVVFVSARKVRNSSSESGRHQEQWSAITGEHPKSNTNHMSETVVRRRIKRETIPAVDWRNETYRQLFNDSNYVQLSAARSIGINPHTLGDPAKSDELVSLFSTKCYHVDTMYHSRPFLIPEAVLLLHYIGDRFQKLMHERYPDLGAYKVIVTSALRTEESERNLRRVNRNATDTSCHIYGTTFDISAQRYLCQNETDTVVDRCKEILAEALYEIRYEGLCYVKYERGSCFHITLRTTQYEGESPSEMKQYVNPGSPTYLGMKTKTKPKTKTITKTQSETAAEAKPTNTTIIQSHTTPTSNKKSKTTDNTKTRPDNKDNKKSQTASKTQSKKEPTKQPPAVQQPRLTDRERLSLEQFERSY